MRALVWFLVVVVVLALVLDRGGKAIAEQVVASNLQSEQGLSQEPDVSIDGFPFLDQFAEGRYDHVSASADSVPVEDTALTLRSVRVDFRGVTTNRDFSRFTAQRAAATATIGYAGLGRALGVTTSYAGDGRVKISKKLSALGGSITPSATIEPTYERGSLRFGDLDLGDDLPDSIGSALRDAVDDAVRLDDLPFDVTVQSVRATEQGLRLTLRGKDLSYSKAS
ncbi:hypothetical protein GCM10011519_08880 [Marmoricola endophyticus]|uniref:DUF2993 domain-containing protein n=1 Tax=Marmoricola endophyticus TaxID=2040280 RepID=A0A917EZP6_9ACTN|nr:DUF2993 domain-containing protein [Marmoricola endophyticus]GGF37530.1 hypothetical protein GCM10011519_08880 [Marmoricola endophyticus]